ncbi:chromosomal replication initiator protein DnaA [Gordonia hirsuta DSM 44140 = NBRC 16056]|uniref:Chromosomal replication initiator protein DnaA n=1 Tax=Gordonia hirsuta DSM 44140 = NBRC 16056 TaxID=1121927 RepID=L7L9Y1_9ACTN|nr:chromosomal replication initiator protein DnaA [Gordonia hirsuta]GAC57734.1 chromosomal replication initiator protein DnaA [Gordonia hirsuta DSM 44140 = NBRC 16056]
MTDDHESFSQVWNLVVDELKNSVTEDAPPLTQQQKAWLSLARPLTITAGFALLTAPNALVQEQIERNLRDTIGEALSRHLGQPVEVAVRIAEHDEEPPVAEPAAPAAPPRPEQPVPVDRPGAPRTGGTRDWAAYFDDRTTVTAPEDSTTTLHPKYTFDTFVIGTSNRFAHASAVAVAEAPARAYNPLFIWGESGLGKTHLLHAAGHYAQRLFPGMRVKYVSTEEFTNDFINSLRDDRQMAFKNRYRGVDMLLVDDIQFLEGREGIQEEFFHTFNTLHNANKQIIISSDRPPSKLTTLEDRLRTRFEWGLITDVQPPDLETRIAILRKKAQQEQLDVPDNVLESIASRIERNIRELEGALIRVTAFASLQNKELDLALAEEVLKSLSPAAGVADIGATGIMDIAADYYSISVDDLRGPGRKQPLVGYRQIAMYLCRELTDQSLPQIGEAFNRDHTTVMHAERKIREALPKNPDVYNDVQQLTARIKQRARG